MKAVVHDRYGPPEVVRVELVALPSPAPGQVRLEVAATSVNLSDSERLRGTPAYVRIGGLRSPGHPTLGSDVAGVVDAVGDGVTGFEPGDQVYGDNLELMGGFAQFALAPETALARKPAGLTFAEASTIPQAGAIALQGTALAGPGRRVLINGAGGGSGAFAIQLAKRLGAHVTGGGQRRQAGLHAQGLARTWSSTTASSGTSRGPTRRTTWCWTWSRIDPSSPTAGPWRLAAPTGAWAGQCPPCCGWSPPGSLAGRLTGRSIGILLVKQGPAHFEPLADLCVELAGRRSHRPDLTRSTTWPAALAHVGEGRALGKVVVVPSCVT